MSYYIREILPTVVEIVLLSAVVFFLWKKSSSKIYPAFTQLLQFRLGYNAALVAVISIAHFHYLSVVPAYKLYFYSYWLGFLIDAVLVFRVVHEMYRRATVALPGIQKLGAIAFRWAVAISGVVAFAAALTPRGNAVDVFVTAASVTARCESILVLCLIAFFAFAAETLGMSYRSRVFGVTFGLAMMATSNLVESAFFSGVHSLTPLVDVIATFVQVSAMALWLVYFLKPEPQRKLVVVETTAPLMRWNEIARMFGNPAGQVVVSHPASFMTDVHDVVDKVMQRRPNIGIVS
ncbi:MAG TPA: hypothetical protein VHX63_07140 [Acidobacteriaceae bacterium]|jgi:hypothetical protein|nr:hypothetical protein [Acidobacteriaceae bacterium]